MAGKKRHEAAYAGYVYEKPVTYWTSTDEVQRHLTEVDLADPYGIEAGGMPIISNGKTAFIDEKDGHTAVIACSGMKKSICCFMPLIVTLAKAGENMILTDPKGELYSRTSGYLESLGYKVLCLDFRSMNKDCYNILYYPASTYRKGDKDKGLALLSDIVNVLAEDQRNKANDPFWPDIGALWLNGTGALMIDAYPKIEQVNVLNWSDYNDTESSASLNGKVLSMMPSNTVKDCLKKCISMQPSEKTYASILGTASSFLATFMQNPKLAEMISHNTFMMDDLIKSKTALYFVTDDTTSTADKILGIIIRQIQSYLVNEAFSKKRGSLETRMNFILDEFASIPISDMDKALATHRSRNIRYYICVQSLALLKERYGEPSKLLSNCASILYLGTTELEFLSQFEEQLGNSTVTPDGSEKPLCSKAELMMLEKAWDHKEAIYLNLMDGIRYCTMLPSIEAYNIGDYAAPNYSSDPPEIETYTVSEFVSDVLNGRICSLFEEVDKTEGSRKKRRKWESSSQSSPSVDDLEKELERKFNELFGTEND